MVSLLAAAGLVASSASVPLPLQAAPGASGNPGGPLASVSAPRALSDLRGTVLEAESGNPIAGAVVDLVGLGRAATSDSAGAYRLDDIASGTHRLRVSRVGYETRELEVFLPEGARVRVEIELVTHAIPLRSLWVMGTADSPLPATHSGNRPALGIGSRDVGPAEARLAVLPGGPDYLSALAGGSVTADPESPTGLHVRGGAADQTGVLLDGVPLLVPYHAGGAFGSLSPDAISRAELAGAVPSAALGGTLAGPLLFRSASPSRDRLRIRGSVSPWAVRTAASGPIGSAGFLVTARRVDPRLFSPGGVAVTNADAADLFGKIVTPLGGGRLALVGFWMRDRTGFSLLGEEPADLVEAIGRKLGPAEVADLERVAGGDPRNRFGWAGHTVAASWTAGEDEGGGIRVRAFTSGLAAGSRWLERGGDRFDLEGERALAGIEVEASRGVLRAGVSARRDGIEYLTGRNGEPLEGADEGGAGAQPGTLGIEDPQGHVAVFVEARPEPTEGIELGIGLRGSAAEGRPPLLEPRLAARIALVRGVDWSIGFARTVQDVQSLRNDEFLTARLFAADPAIGSGSPGVPAARAAEIATAVEVGTRERLSVRLLAFYRRMDGLVLVGPMTGRPFAIEPHDVAIGEGRARGIELAGRWLTGPWWAGLEYGIASTERRLAGSTFRPGFATTHSLSGTLAFAAADGLLVHLSVLASGGRRTTPLLGLGEYEGCNGVGGGCEIAGFPTREPGELNRLALPTYLRLDLGVRQGWDVHLFGRNGRIDGFLRLANLTNHRNVLGYTRPDGSHPLRPIPMLGIGALTLGVDWAF